jgi:hypothetical protein
MIVDGWRGPSWRVVDADPRYGGQVRDWIRSAITRHDCHVDAADAALAVAELYANAVMHGPAGGLAEGGRGLQVINALAARWDCLLLAGTQVVWCDFGQPLPAAPGDAWAWLRLVVPACDLSPMAGAPVHTGADDRHAIAGPTTMPDSYPRGYFTECRAAGPTEVREVAVSEPQEGTRAGREFRRADRGARGQP